MTLHEECPMPDKISLSKKTIHFMDNVERVALRTLGAMERITFRLLLYALALLEAFRLLGKHR
jgi:hypothetical protein